MLWFHNGGQLTEPFTEISNWNLIDPSSLKRSKNRQSKKKTRKSFFFSCLIFLNHWRCFTVLIPQWRKQNKCVGAVGFEPGTSRTRPINWCWSKKLKHKINVNSSDPISKAWWSIEMEQLRGGERGSTGGGSSYGITCGRRRRSWRSRRRSQCKEWRIRSESSSSLLLSCPWWSMSHWNDHIQIYLSNGLMSTRWKKPPSKDGDDGDMKHGI